MCVAYVSFSFHRIGLRGDGYGGQTRPFVRSYTVVHVEKCCACLLHIYSNKSVSLEQCISPDSTILLTDLLTGIAANSSSIIIDLPRFDFFFAFFLEDQNLFFGFALALKKHVGHCFLCSN